MSELRTIPNVGACTEQDLILMGYPTIASLRGKSAEELYAGECRLRGCTLDRCQLYLYRAVEYFVNTVGVRRMQENKRKSILGTVYG